MAGNRWARGADDFAARVEVNDVPGFFRKAVIIEPGTQAVLLADGRNVGKVGPGKYTLDNLVARIATLGTARQVTAILIDASDVDLAFSIGDLYTQDPLRVTMDCHMVVSLADPLAFLSNVMKAQYTYSLSQLRSFLFDELQNAAQECISGHTVEQLNSNLALKQEFAVAIEAHLNRTFERSGLRFDRVRTLNYRHPRWDEVRQTTEEYFLQISKAEADLEGRKRLFDVFDREQLQAIAEETARVIHYEKRAAVKERMRKAVLSGRMGEITDEREFERFMRQVDRERLIEENEWRELVQDFKERKEDHDAARAHLVARLAVERDYERRLAELALRRDLSFQELSFEQELARRRMAGQMQLEEQRWTFDLRRQREQAEFRRAQEEADRQARLKALTDEALTKAEIDELELRVLEKELDLGLKGLRGIKAVSREDLEEQLRIRWEDDRRRLEGQLAAEERRLEMELKKLREEHQQELRRLEAYAQMSTEALLAATGPEQGRLLVELQKTETLKGMTEDQILALAAERSPQVAAAFQEKFRAMAAPEQRQQLEALYERMLAEQKAGAAELAALQRETAQRLQQMFETALREHREAVTALGRTGPAAGPTVIFPPGGQPTVVPVGGAPGAGNAQKVIICPSCHIESPVGTRYCQNCGEKLF